MLYSCIEAKTILNSWVLTDFYLKIMVSGKPP